MDIAAVVLTVLFILLFTRSAIPKVTRAAQVARTAAHLRVPVGLMYTVGYLELLGVAGLAAGLAHPDAGLAAATGLAVLMAGAATVHVRAGDPWKITIAPVAIGVLVLVLAVLQIQLR